MHKQLEYGTTTITYALHFAERKTLGVRVDPTGEVTVVAPLGTALATIEQKLLKKADWIRRQRDFFLAFRPRATERRFLSGETHLYLGRQYRLKVQRVTDGISEGVSLRGGYFHLRTLAPECAAR